MIIVMKHLYLKLSGAICVGIMFFAILGVVGDYDYCEQIILHMTQEQYDSVKSHLYQELGKQPSERQIAHWWAEHHGDNK